MHSPPSPRPLSGRAVLAWLVGFFGVVIGVNMVMMKLAIDTLPGLDVDSAYRASLAYNAEIQAARDQAARRWSVTGHLERNGDGAAAVNVEARDAESIPLTGLAFSARLLRPTDKRADRVVALSEREPGRYRGHIPDVGLGQWDLVIEADRGSERLFLSRNRVILK